MSRAGKRHAYRMRCLDAFARFEAGWSCQRIAILRGITFEKAQALVRQGCDLNHQFKTHADLHGLSTKLRRGKNRPSLI